MTEYAYRKIEEELYAMRNAIDEMIRLVGNERTIDAMRADDLPAERENACVSGTNAEPCGGSCTGAVEARESHPCEEEPPVVPCTGGRTHTPIRGATGKGVVSDENIMGGFTELFGECPDDSMLDEYINAYRTRWSQMELDELRLHIENGVSVNDMARALRRSRSSVVKQAWKMGFAHAPKGSGDIFVERH